MAMVDLKLPKKKREEMSKPVPLDDMPEYPWGTKVTLEKACLDKLPTFKSLKAGDMVTFESLGKVTEVRVTDKDQSREHHTVEIQIQKMGPAKVKKGSKAASMKDIMTEVTTNRTM